MATGFRRYIFGKKYILGSTSFKIAFEKIDNDIKKYRVKDVYYDRETLWGEFQLLFAIQYVEHETAEFVSKLANEKKIIEEFFKKIASDKRLDRKRWGTVRAFSPYALTVCLGFSLGKLIEIISDRSYDFGNKEQIVGKLKDFNTCRIDFIHKSFSSSRDMDETMSKGMKLSEDILKFYDK